MTPTPWRRPDPAAPPPSHTRDRQCRPYVRSRWKTIDDGHDRQPKSVAAQGRSRVMIPAAAASAPVNFWLTSAADHRGRGALAMWSLRHEHDGISNRTGSDRNRASLRDPQPRLDADAR